MKLEILKLNASKRPSHYLVGENVFWAGMYWIEEKESFQAGTNILVGNLSEGGWALTYALAMPKKYLDKSSQILVNGKNCSARKLDKLTFYVGDCSTYKHSKKTMKQIISKYEKNFSKVRLEELFHKLGINPNDESFYKKPLYDAGKDIWKYFVLIGILLGKRIFLFPWISSPMLMEMCVDVLKIGEVIKEQDSVLMIPVEDDIKIRESQLEYERCRLTQICGQVMKREKVNIKAQDFK